MHVGILTIPVVEKIGLELRPRGVVILLTVSHVLPGTGGDTVSLYLSFRHQVADKPLGSTRIISTSLVTDDS